MQEFDAYGYSGIFHAEANIVVCLGGVAIPAIRADCGGRRARVSLFTGSRGRRWRSPQRAPGLAIVRRDRAVFAPDQNVVGPVPYRSG